MKSVLLVWLAFFSFSAFPCTSFLLKNPVNKIMAKSYDWYLGHGYILTNKRNIRKKTLTLLPEDVPTNWTSKYGSTTINQYGQEFPNSGVNEKGLVVEILWLNETVYPPPDERPSFNELQWIQYQLDNFGSVAEMVSNADKVRVAKIFADVHYLACDSSGQCGLFEYLKGKLQVTSGEKLTPRLITNSSFQQSAPFLKNYVGFGGSTELPSGNESLHRYVRAAHEMKCAEATSERAFDILELVKQSDSTKWQIVYDLIAGTIGLKTSTNWQLRTVRTGFDYSCKSNVLSYNLDEQSSGDVTSLFSNWTSEANRSLIEKSFSTMGELGKKLIPPAAAYPSSNVCLE